MVSEPLAAALQHLLKTLSSLGIPSALVGGLSLAVWNHLRLTKDVDLLVDIEPDDINSVIATLAQAGIRPKHDPPSLAVGELQIVQLLYEPPDMFLDIQIDLLIANSDYQRRALARRIPAKLPNLDVDISVLTCEDVVVFKLAAGRMIDLADAAALLRNNQDSIDVELLHNECVDLGIVTDLKRVWNDAFPDESSPF